MTPHAPHTAFVACVCAAGLLMILVGIARLRATRLDRETPYSSAAITTVYSTMILFGAGFLVFALHWRFFS